jgi:hypothetical protein
MSEPNKPAVAAVPAPYADLVDKIKAAHASVVAGMKDTVTKSMALGDILILVDEFHPWTPLCGECYSNKHRREVTARPVGLSEHQLKLYRVRSAYELSDLIADVNDAVYGGDANSIRGVADELVELADDIDAGEPDSRYTKETYDERPNPS